MAAGLREHVAEMIGKIARPHALVFTDDLPKTRSGKIMRRLLRDVAHGREPGGVTSLANGEFVEQLRGMATEADDECRSYAALARGGEVRPLGARGSHGD